MSRIFLRLFPTVLAACCGILLPISAGSLSSQPAATADPADLVDPTIGTAGGGQTFPTAGVPFSLTDWTPETEPGETKCVPPYLYKDSRITGFRGSHFPTGSCTQDYGSVSLMPTVATPRQSPIKFGARFTHADEQQQPYFYGVDLRDEQIRAEMTGTLHCGFLRFRFPGGANARVQVRLNGAPADDLISIHATHREITGSAQVRRIYAGQGRPAGFRSYFVAQFEQPFSTTTRPDGTTVSAGFKMAPGAWVQVRVGTSFVSLDEARQNLRAEMPDWNFARCEQAAHTAWNQALGRIDIAGNAPQRRIFYTALYHSLLLPRTVSDADGAYPGFNGNAKTEHARGFTYYDDYSLWDTFRAVHPLLTLLDPARETDMIRSLIAKGEQGGFLPIFPAWNSYTAEMIGDHADAVIADGWYKGLRGFPVDKAYLLMRHNALTAASPAQAQNGEGRRALASYLKLGYIPLEDHIPDAFHHDEQVSRTLEYAYDDWAVGRMAAALGKRDDATLFAKRAGNWRNVFDPSSGFARGRHADGQWQQPFDPAKLDPAVTESTPWEYTFFVPQDVAGLRAALGGPRAMAAKLDGLFARGLYDQGNEPGHAIAYLYNDAGQPSKTQAEVRRILDTLYTDTPAGLPGNDDAGQMSAWYVFSALGFYPVTPGLPQYAIGTPRFDRVTLRLPNGRRFTILAPGAERGRRYVQSVTLNGKLLDRLWIEHAEIAGGGTLVFTMGAAPQTLMQ